MNNPQIAFSIINQLVEAPQALKHQRRLVQQTLLKVRQLHEELNALLYTRSTVRSRIRAYSKVIFNVVCPNSFCRADSRKP